MGVLPFYVVLTDGESKDRVKRILRQAITTAFLVGILFLFAGKLIFQFLGITVADFKVAGGTILLVIAVTDLLFADKRRRKPLDDIGVVPLGMPLIVGPAVLTAILMQHDLVGVWPTLTAFAINLLITYFIFRLSDPIVDRIGRSGTQAISKVANLILAAIGVMYIRAGISDIIMMFP